MQLFNDYICDMAFIDVPLTGRRYMWSNKQPVSIFSKLDWVLLSSAWATQFPVILLRARLITISDHVPMLLVCKQDASVCPPLRIEKVCVIFHTSNYTSNHTRTQDSHPTLFPFILFHKTSVYRKELCFLSISFFLFDSAPSSYHFLIHYILVIKYYIK
jgi:hypothetical protein